MALDIDFTGSTTDIVVEVIGLTHGSMGFDGDTHTLERIVALLENTELGEMDEDFIAQQDVTAAAIGVVGILWNRYTGGGASAAATCSLFHALGRETELGWLVREGNYSEYNRQRVSELLLERRVTV